ncbi:MAG: hypothetical protein QM662_17940, partial [Gordonia sp. (in: high G+C Gram-positive bacteria)]
MALTTITDWYDDPDDAAGAASDGDFFDAPVALDMSKVPSRTAGLPIDVDLVTILAGSTGLASKPDAAAIATDLVEDIRGFITALMQTLESGDPAPLLTWITTTAGDWVGDLSGWELALPDFDPADLEAAIAGTYTGDDDTYLAIQSAITTLRSGLTGIIDWSRIPQISLSQLTNAAGPNL